MPWLLLFDGAMRNMRNETQAAQAWIGAVKDCQIRAVAPFRLPGIVQEMPFSRRYEDTDGIGQGCKGTDRNY